MEIFSATGIALDAETWICRSPTYNFLNSEDDNQRARFLNYVSYIRIII